MLLFSTRWKDEENLNRNLLRFSGLLSSLQSYISTLTDLSLSNSVECSTDDEDYYVSVTFNSPSDLQLVEPILNFFTSLVSDENFSGDGFFWFCLKEFSGYLAGEMSFDSDATDELLTEIKVYPESVVVSGFYDKKYTYTGENLKDIIEDILAQYFSFIKESLKEEVDEENNK